MARLWINNLYKNIFFQCVPPKSHSWPWRLLSYSNSLFLEVEEKNPRVSFLECPYISVASPALRLDLNAERWWSATKRPAAPRHLAPIKKKLQTTWISSSSSFCLAAGRANLRASCSLYNINRSFYPITALNNHSYLTLQCLEPCINTTPLLEFTHIQSNRFCSKFLQNTFSSFHLYERTTPWNSHAIFNCR